MLLEPNDYPEGIDYEWFAVDSAGHIAAFTTGGTGPIPAAALSDLASEDALNEFLLQHPVRGWATLLVTLPRPDDYIAFAERGLYTYDWADVHRTAGHRTGVYELYSCPTCPITISELPTQFQSLLKGRILGETQFKESKHIDIRALAYCREPAAATEL